MHTQKVETQQIEIAAALGQSKLILRRDSIGELIGVGIRTPDYNVTTVVNIPDFLTAARVLCEPQGASPSSPDQKASVTMLRVFDRITAERIRQNLLIDAGKIPWNCANPMVPLRDKALVFAEETAEAMREFCAHASAMLVADRDEAKQRLREELIQVAAVSVAILESMECQP